MLVLGIESTCDETACSIVKDGKEILSNVIASQQEIHKKYGGVYPEVSCRAHIEALIPTLDASLKEAGVNPALIELIAVAKGPGLIGALLIGLNAAKALSLAWNIPYIGVNHVEAHLYAAMMQKDTIFFPSLGVVVSGGHTFMIQIKALGDYQLVGSTVDDAVGEAFDKVSRLLDLPYPGGPHIEQLAKFGNKKAFAFTAGKVKERPLDFSFSGLKTSVLYKILELTDNKQKALTDQQKCNIAASFQEAAFKSIVNKSLEAANSISAHSIFLGGGVSCNQALRDMFELKAQIPVFFPPKELCVDNAAMIAGLGYHRYQMQKGGDSLDLEPMTRIPISS